MDTDVGGNDKRLGEPLVLVLPQQQPAPKVEAFKTFKRLCAHELHKRAFCIRRV